MRTIRFYRTESGRCPVEQFLESLSPQHRKKVAWVLRLIEELDLVPQEYLKKLVGSDALWEIRSQVGGSSYRFIGFFDGGTFLILTNGFSKKQQKTPAQEIELAQQRRKEYLMRRKP